MPFPLMALGAGLGQAAEQYRQQQESAQRMLQTQLAMQEMQQRQQEQQRLLQAQRGAFALAGSPGFGGLQMPQQQPMGGMGGAPMTPVMRQPPPAQPAAMQQPAPNPMDFGAAGEYGAQQAAAPDRFPQPQMAQAPAGPDTLVPSKGDPRGLIPFIQQTAQKYGIDPAVAVRVAQSEGLSNPIGDGGKSGGAFQLYTGGGLGNEFEQDTGQSPLNLANERETIDYALKKASEGGWGPWHGAQRIGIGQWQGINRQGGAPGGDQADPMTQIRQDVTQGLQRTAQITPPSVYGKMGLQGLVGQIEKAMPGVDDATKFLALQEATKLLAPDAKVQLELYKEQRQHDWARELQELQASRQMQQTKYAHDLRQSEGTPTVMTDPTTGKQYVYDVRSKKATTLSGEPYEPEGAQKLGGTGGSPLSADRAKDLATETSRLDKEWVEANPAATEAQKQAAHFKNRAEAEKVLANAKSSDTRQSPRTMIFRKAMEEHPEFTPEEMQTYINNMDLNSKITASFANGDAAKQMRAVNTVADHILRVQDYAEALRNGNLPRANQLANAASKEMGRPEVTTFEAGRDIMADEVVRLLTSTGGTEADRKGMQERISAMMSPEQFAGVFGAFRDFSGARFEALRQQYSHNDPRREAEFKQFLTPAAATVFEGMKPPKLPNPYGTDRASPGVVPAPPPGGPAMPPPEGGAAPPPLAVKEAPPPVPPKLAGKKLMWSPSQQKFYDENDNAYDKDGNPVQ